MAKRRLSKGRALINAEAIAAFKAKDAGALHRALGLKPWEPSPLDCVGECDRPGTAYALAWPKVAQIRATLIAAANQL